MCSASFVEMPSTVANSATLASRIALTEPNLRIRAFLRLGPTPGTSSRLDWKVALRRWPMEGDGEAVRLVADALDEEERLRIARQEDRVWAAGQEQLLVLLGQAGDRRPVMPTSSSAAEGGVELALAAVDDDEIGQGRPTCRPASLRRRRWRGGSGGG